MANKNSGGSKSNQSNNYKINKVWERNRLRRLKKLLITQPNNKQIQEAISNIRYRRKNPKAPFWSSTRIKTAMIFKEFVGRVNLDIFNNNEKVVAAALLLKGPHSDYKAKVTQNEKEMFQLGTRARWGGVV